MKVKNLSEYKKKIIELIESDITGYQVFKDTGLSQTVMSSLRTGKRDIDNLRVGTAEKLYEYACKVL